MQNIFSGTFTFFAWRAMLLCIDTPLRKARQEIGRTLKEVAEAVGTDPGNLSRIERGSQLATVEMAEKLAKYYGGRITELQILYPARYGASA